MPRLMFQRPRRIEWEEINPRFGRIVAEPFEKGYALTIGHSLRRVLLSVVPGAAITWARLDGVDRDATRVPGVREDRMTLLLNLKKTVVRVHADGPATLRLDVAGPRSLTAGDLGGAGVEVMNPELELATLETRGRLRLEAGVRVGRGYVSAERHGESLPAGAVALDAAFSPILRVNYLVEMSRLGKIIDYEKLVVEIGTNGSITPDQAFLRAARVLRDHFDLFTPAGAEEEDEEGSVEPTVSSVESTVSGEASTPS